MCLTIRPQHKLHMSSVKHKHLTARATNRTHFSAGFCLSCVCVSIMKSSRRRFAAGSSVFKAPPSLSLPLHVAGCLVPPRSVEKTTGSSTCSPQVTIETVGREVYVTATSRVADQRDAVLPIHRQATPTAKRAADTQWARNCVNERGVALWSTTC